MSPSGVKTPDSFVLNYFNLTIRDVPTMYTYNGKAKCSCGKKAKYKAVRINEPFFACEKHKDRIASLHRPIMDSGRLTEADYQTWANGMTDGRN